MHAGCREKLVGRWADLEGPKACQDTEEAGFAAAVGSHDHDGGPWWNLKGQVPHQRRSIWTIQRYPAHPNTEVNSRAGKELDLKHALSACCSWALQP